MVCSFNAILSADGAISMYYCPHEGCAYKTLQKSNLESHFNVQCVACRPLPPYVPY